MGVKDFFIKKDKKNSENSKKGNKGRVPPPEPFRLKGSRKVNAKQGMSQGPKSKMNKTKLGPVRDMVRKKEQNQESRAKPGPGISKPLAKPSGLKGLKRNRNPNPQNSNQEMNSQRMPMMNNKGPSSRVAADFFIKVDEFKDVKAGIKKLGMKVKDLNNNLEKMEKLKKDEEAKISNLKRTVNEMKSLALELDKVFTKE